MKQVFKVLIISAVLTPLLSSCWFMNNEKRYVSVKISDKKESWSIVDVQDGKIIAEDAFSNCPSAIVDGLFFVKNDKGEYELYSVDDVNRPIGDTFKAATYFEDGRAVVRKDDALVIIDKNANVVAKLPGTVKAAGGFENGMAMVMDENDKFGFIDTDGNIVIKMSYDVALPFGDDGYAVVGKKDEAHDDVNYTVIDKKGEKLFGFSKSKYGYPVSNFINGSIAVCGEKEVVYLDKTGAKMVKIGDAEGGLYGFFCGMSIYADGKKFGIKNEKGEKIINAKYDALWPIGNGNFIATKDDKWMIIDKEGNRHTEDNYEGIAKINNNRFIVKNSSKKFSFIDEQGKDIGQDAYDDFNVLDLDLGFGSIIYYFKNMISVNGADDNINNSFGTSGYDYDGAAIDSLAAAIDSAYESSAPTSLYFTPPTYNNNFSDYVIMFTNILGNITEAWYFTDEINKSKVSGKQAKYDSYDGVRYQYFFDKSPKSENANITGIAISVESYESDSECSALDNALTSRGYEFVKLGMWRAPNGLYISPGFTADRVYAYIYYPNAPDKSSAPRRY